MTETPFRRVADDFFVAPQLTAADFAGGVFPTGSQRLLSAFLPVAPSAFRRLPGLNYGACLSRKTGKTKGISTMKP